MIGGREMFEGELGSEPVPKCVCCDGPEPEDGWYLIGGGGPPETWEFYCSQACFQDHEDRVCDCFPADDMDEGDEIYG